MSRQACRNFRRSTLCRVNNKTITQKLKRAFFYWLSFNAIYHYNSPVKFSILLFDFPLFNSVYTDSRKIASHWNIFYAQFTCKNKRYFNFSKRKEVYLIFFYVIENSCKVTGMFNKFMAWWLCVLYNIYVQWSLHKAIIYFALCLKFLSILCVHISGNCSEAYELQKRMLIDFQPFPR